MSSNLNRVDEIQPMDKFAYFKTIFPPIQIVNITTRHTRKVNPLQRTVTHVPVEAEKSRAQQKPAVSKKYIFKSNLNKELTSISQSLCENQEQYRCTQYFSKHFIL